ncbi:MAG: DUF2993 domain-containing protein [Acetobacteraceae bacterium]|nr:DUF2993 domain-containing protein [Acetobacteraceae bacterium]
MLRVVLAVVIVLAILAGAIQWLVPRVVERGVEAALADYAAGEGGGPEVQFLNRPALRLILGQVERVTVESRSVKAAGLLIDRMTVALEGVALNLRQLLAHREFQVRRGERLEVELEIGEAALNRYLWEAVKELKDSRMRLAKDRATLNATLVLPEGTSFKLGIQGRFVPVGPARVGLVVDQLSIDDQVLPAGLTSKLIQVLGGPEAFIDLGLLPVPMTVTSVEMGEGKLLIRGERVGR